MLTLLLSSFRVSIDMLRGNPLRTVLSTLGIVIGVASLVAVLSLGDGMQSFMRAQIGETTDLQVLSISSRTQREVDGVPLPTADTVRFDQRDVAAVRKVVTAVIPADQSVAVGLAQSSIALANTTKGQRAVQIVGTTPEILALQNVSVQSGRLLDAADSNADVVLLSRGAMRALARTENEVLRPGDSVTLGGARLSVVGVLAGNQTESVITAALPLTTAEKVAAMSGRAWLPSLLVRTSRVDEVIAARTAIERWLATSRGPAWKSRVQIGSRADRVAQVQQSMLLFKLFMGAITGISLIVGGIGVMNVLLAAVAERTREIGVRRAVGAERRHIMAQFLAESVTISAVGSVAGVVLGVAGAYGITALIRANTKARMYAGLSMSTVVVAVVATVVVGLTFGMYPALRAARLSPIDAIRHE